MVIKIKFRKTAWLESLERTEKHRQTKKIKEWKLGAFRPRARPKMNCVGDIKQVATIYHW